MELRLGHGPASASAIPAGWSAGTLGNLVALQRGHDLTWRDRRSGDVPVMGSAGQNGFHDTALAKGPGLVVGRSGASFGRAHFCNRDFWPHNTALYVTDFRGNDPLFAFYLLSSIDFSRHNTGGAQQSLNRNFIYPIPIAIPPVPEQRVIATALSDVHALLASLDKLIVKKRDLKQAAMQQLLTGQTRLPGFNGEWVRVPVRDLISRHFSGPSPTCEERNVDGDAEWGVLKTTAITKEHGWDWTKHKVLPKHFSGNHDLQLELGDVLVTKAGPRHRVGIAAWIDRVPLRIIPSGKMVVLRPRPDRAVPLMLAAAIGERDPQTYLDQRTTGMAESQVNFENEALLSTLVRLPELPEQMAIAQVFNDMQAELAALEARREKTIYLKQGMMQELLTGRTRLV